LNLVFDKIKYNQRNIVETIFSVVKRKLGETLRERKFRYQVREIKIKLIVYNTNKKVIEIICIKLRISKEPKLKKNIKYEIVKVICRSEKDSGTSTATATSVNSSGN